MRVIHILQSTNTCCHGVNKTVVDCRSLTSFAVLLIYNSGTLIVCTVVSNLCTKTVHYSLHWGHAFMPNIVLHWIKAIWASAMYIFCTELHEGIHWCPYIVPLQCLSLLQLHTTDQFSLLWIIWISRISFPSTEMQYIIYCIKCAPDVSDGRKYAINQKRCYNIISMISLHACLELGI